MGMANVLNEEKKQQVLALGRLGWSLRRIQQETKTGGDFNVIPEDIDCHKPSSWVWLHYFGNVAVMPK